MTNNNKLLTLQEAGDYTNTSKRFMQRLVTERRIAVTRLGKHVRISQSALDSWIAESTQPAHDRWAR